MRRLLVVHKCSVRLLRCRWLDPWRRPVAEIFPCTKCSPSVNESVENVNEVSEQKLIGFHVAPVGRNHCTNIWNSIWRWAARLPFQNFTSSDFNRRNSQEKRSNQIHVRSPTVEGNANVRFSYLNLLKHGANAQSIFATSIIAFCIGDHVNFLLSRLLFDRVSSSSAQNQSKRCV